MTVDGSMIIIYGSTEWLLVWGMGRGCLQSLVHLYKRGRPRTMSELVSCDNYATVTRCKMFEFQSIQC